MREQIKKILELYEQGLSLGEICEELKLTSGEFNRLLKIIRDSGYNTSKTYSSDGKITAKINKTLNFKTSNAIRINVKDKILRAVFISDPHIGSEFERPDLLKKVISDVDTFDSALDLKTDAKLRKELKSKTKDATVLIVAQRISTILHADQIVVLDEGKVVGIGTHDYLMKNCEVYKQIALSQLSKEELDNE